MKTTEITARLTIIIATCDRPDRLAKTSASVAAAMQVAGGDHDLIVADNGRKESAAEVVERLADTMPGRVRYLKTEPGNKARALNAAVAAAETDWVAFTDDDTFPDSRWLWEGAAFARESRCRFFGGRIVTGPVDRPLPRWLKWDGSGKGPASAAFITYAPLSASGLLGQWLQVPLGANAFARRDVFRQYGGYSEALWVLCGRAALGVEDGEFGARLQAAGEPIGYCHEAVVVHPVHYERLRVPGQLRWAYHFGWRDPLVFFDRNRPVVEMYRLRLTLRWIVTTAAALCRGDSAEAFREAMKLARNVGSMVCRLSLTYRKRTRIEATGSPVVWGGGP